MGEYKSFFKTVGGNEGDKCRYSTRLDTYGCGCQHDCNYCYAKSLLNFRNLWDPKEPAVADISRIINKVRKMPMYPAVRLGGMTDCFQPMEVFKELTVCEDETEAYQYWRDHVNPNKEDCCNLRTGSPVFF